VPYKRQARVGPDEDKVYSITGFSISQGKNEKNPGEKPDTVQRGTNVNQNKIK
jgi:hypothetical protein